MKRVQRVAAQLTASSPPPLSDSNSRSPPFKVLVANRGEIAVRICRAAQELNYATVAVYASDDNACMHTAVADEARLLPGPPGPAAYLDVDAIMQAARESGATAIHPGYGFLSEDPRLAAACEKQGIIFVGPSSSALELLGDKMRARALAIAQNVPVSKGTGSGAANVKELRAEIHQSGLSYPVMLKAANGGGGRGIRIVESDEQLDAAYERCASEAESAFGRTAIFAEQYVAKAKHIEVQVLMDTSGDAVHLFERDCSVQMRNQKVVELAPAYGISSSLRARLTGAALTLVRAAGYSNAGTVEFLVEGRSSTTGDNPLSDEGAPFYFLEVNPRIQVEHTITEQVTGVDLVAAQLQIAVEGRSLQDLGLHQASLCAHGYAIQARVTLASPTAVAEYAEPAGVGVRVDAACYAGYQPSGLYDPLIAKVICSGGRHLTGGIGDEAHATNHFEALSLTIRRTKRALSEFHIGGVLTNVPLLMRVLSDESFCMGLSTTAWLEAMLAQETSTTGTNAANAGNSANLLRQGLANAAAVTGVATRALDADDFAFQDNHDVPKGGIVAPLAGTVVELKVSVGQIVHRGQHLMILSAMKMESAVTANASGKVVSIAVAEQSTVQLGQVLLVLDEGQIGEAADSVVEPPQSTWAPEIEELEKRRQLIGQLGGEERIAKHKANGKMTCRERVSAISDNGKWREIGALTGRFQYDPQTGKMVGLSVPANAVIGMADIDGRPCALSADDFTIRGGSAEGSIGDKRGHIERVARDMRCPMIRMLDGNSGGGSVGTYVKGGGTKGSQPKPKFDASRGGTYAPMPTGFHHSVRLLNEVPVVSLLLGTVVGIGAARATGAHFSIIIRGSAQLMVAGPPVVQYATREDLTKEQLGGAAVVAGAGSVDNVAESEADAFAQTRAFLSYLPSSVWTLPPRGPTDDPPDRAEGELLSVVPRERKQFMDSRRAIELIVDKGSFFEVGQHWARNMIVGFARLHGYPVGIFSSDARFKGGALDTPASMKLRRHADICELFHVPVLNLVDMPGFLVGSEAERTGVIRYGMTVAATMYNSTVPRFTCIMRRAFGVAGQVMIDSASDNPIGVSARVAWPSADWGSLPLEGGIEAAYGRQLRAQPDGGEAMKQELFENMEKIRSPFRTADSFGIEDIIDPRATRPMACQWVELAYEKLRHGDQLGPRPGFFRP